MRLPHIW